jgi:Asp-tRNA(Asn)/Glu-tRNA(Gln) amidotransferase A subunit family amidase
MNFTIHAAPAIRNGRLSCVELLERCLGRIDEVEAKVRAWVLVDGDRARAEAVRMDADLKQGRYRGPLHGIPIGVKDIIDVFDWPTACGSAAWKASVARQDAPVVRRLRDAGAVLIGKTVTTAFASFDPPVTRNPWNLARTPGGSSSGSAAAVATRMCYAALGSQTGGSITRPASYCGVAGMKPTYGAVNIDGVLPLAESMDHLGPIGRCVHDLAVLMQAIADPPARDWVTALEGYQERPPILGRPRGLFERLAAADVSDMMDRVCAHYAARGATIRDVALPAAFEDVIAQHRVVMAVESAQFHEERLRRRPEDYPPHITALIREGIDCPAPAYARAKEGQTRLQAEMAELLASVDALICPATTRGAPDAATTGDPAFNSPWSFTGLPVASIPTALDGEGLPLGVQLISAAGGEGRLFAVAAWCEANRETDIGDPSLSSG